MKIWTSEEKEYIKKIVYGKSYKEIQELMNSKFNIDLSLDQIKGAINRYKLTTGRTGYFPKGNIPFNKGKKGLRGGSSTSFKPGNIPVNHRPLFSERVNVYGYRQIKIAEPNKWTEKHKYIWEQHNGPIPADHVVIFADRNKTNLDISNLILLSRKQLLMLNRHKLIKNKADLTRVGINIANIHLKIGELNKK